MEINLRINGEDKTLQAAPGDLLINLLPAAFMVPVAQACVAAGST